MIVQQVRGGKAQVELRRTMGARLKAGHAQHTVTVILQLGRVRIERTAPGRLPFGGQGIGKGNRGSSTAPVTAEGAALAATHGLERSQLHHRELGKHAVHAADGAEVATPQPSLIDQAKNHSPRRNRQ